MNEAALSLAILPWWSLDLSGIWKGGGHEFAGVVQERREMDTCDSRAIPMPQIEAETKFHIQASDSLQPFPPLPLPRLSISMGSWHG